MKLFRKTKERAEPCGCFQVRDRYGRPFSIGAKVRVALYGELRTARVMSVAKQLTEDVDAVFEIAVRCLDSYRGDYPHRLSSASGDFRRVKVVETSGLGADGFMEPDGAARSYGGKVPRFEVPDSIGAFGRRG